MATTADVTELQGPHNFLPTMSVAVDLTGGTEHNFITAANAKPTLLPFARRIFVGVGGDVVLKFVGDSTTRTYKAQSGQYLNGCFESVGSASTATNMIAEQ